MIEPVTIPTPVPPKRRPWRFWRWLRRSVVALLLLLVSAVLVGFAEMKWTRREGQKKLDSLTAKLDAEDPGWRFEDIVAEHNSKVPPDDSNSALKAVKIVKAFPKYDAGRTIWMRHSEMNEGRLPNELPNEVKWKELELEYAAHGPGLIELRKWNEATPRGRFKIDYSGGYPFNIRFDDTEEVRNATAYLAWDSQRFARAGQGDRALASAMAGLHLVRSVDFEPIAIMYFVRVGAANQPIKAVEQTLAWCPAVSDVELAKTQDLVWKESSGLSIRPALRGERAFILKGLDSADRGELDIEKELELKHSSKRERIAFWYLRQFLPANSADIIERFEQLLPMLELPPGEKMKAIEVYEPSSFDREKMIARMLFVPVRFVANYEIQHPARCICTAAGIACERYRLKHGKWPAQLDDLAEFGIPKGLVDPFDGKPLRYALVDDGAVIFSVGKDGRDDGGDVVRREGTPKDVGFRLWNVDKRRVERVVIPEPDE